MEFLLPIPAPHSSNSKKKFRSFKLPPLDSSLVLPEIYDWHLEHNPRHPVFVYENDSAATGYTHLYYSDIVPAAHRAGRIVGKLVGIDVDRPSSQLTKPVAIMASTDMVTSFCTILGMMRAGIPILAFAPRNSPQAVAHLLRTTRSSHLLISSEPSVIELARAACEILASEGPSTIIPRICSMPEYRDIFRNEPYTPLYPRKYDNEIPAILIHSSGSTSLPKPIPWSHHFLLQSGVAPLYGSQNYCGEVFAWHSISMSYGAGIHLLGWVATSGMIVATYRPRTPAQISTPPSALEAFASLGADYLVTFPHYIEEWSRGEESWLTLKRAKRVIYVGGFLNTTVGDYLAKNRIELYPLFGMGEAGVIGAFLPPNQGMGWEYFPLTPHSNATFREVEDGMHELFILKSPIKDIKITNSTLGSSLAYRAGDLFIQHPEKPGYWKVVGRKDDRIIHSNGEKTDPAPLEHILKSDPRVRSVIIFGHGRSRNGVLVELHSDFYFDPQDKDKLKKFQYSFRSTLQRMNEVAPGQSRIFPEMIIAMNINKPFTYTLKGSLKRNLALAAYSEEIEDLYRSTESRSLIKTKITNKASQSEILELVCSIIYDSLLQVSISDDIFYHGCDSLKAMRIENQIRSVLMESPGLVIKAEDVPRWFIYDYPTPLRLASFIFSLISQSYVVQDNIKPDAAKVMLDKLLEDLDTFPVLTEPERTSGEKGAVIVTGTTGDLGAFVLQELVRCEDVNMVVAMSRKSRDVTALDRHIEAFTAKGLDLSVLSSDKIMIIEADFTVEGFGIEGGMLEQLRKTTTHIIHLAWPVNWNMNIASFQDILFATKNLVKFALNLKSGMLPTVMFSSSIGVYWGMDAVQGPVKEAPIVDLQHTGGMGYAESKSIAEVFLDRVSKKTNLKSVILRIGQITSRTWSTSHWFPMIVKSSTTLGCFPDIQGDASWLDVTAVAKAVVETTSTAKGEEVIHILHPRPRPISEIIQHVAAEFRLPIVPYTAWREKLEQAEVSELHALPVLKIGHFLQRDGAHPHSEAPGFPRFGVENAIKLSHTIRDAKTISWEEVDTWISYWRKGGFI